MKYLLLLVFISCQNIPTKTVEETSISFFQIVEIDGKKYIPYNDSLCAARFFEFSKQYIGPRSAFLEVPMEKCNRIIGFSPDAYVEYREYLEAVRVELNKPPKNLKKQ